jgi:hypothetical protein
MGRTIKTIFRFKGYTFSSSLVLSQFVQKATPEQSLWFHDSGRSLSHGTRLAPALILAPPMP